MSESVPSRVARAESFLARHQGLVIPLAYLALMLLGVFHSWLFFLNLGVNILNFADPGDFLLAPLRDPFVILLSIAPLPLYWFFTLSNRVWAARRIAKGKDTASTAELVRRSRQAAWLATALWFLAFSLRYANWSADRIKDGGGTRVSALLANGERLAAPGDSTVALVGTTTRYVLFYAAGASRPGRLHIVPVDQIVRMTKERRPRRAVRTPAPAPLADTALTR